jgi:hypothetical protein
MSAHFKRFLPFIAGGVLLAFGPAALAHCEPKCGPGDHKPPVYKPQPPKPQPPQQPNVKVNVNVHNNVTAIAVAKSSANANASSSGGGEGDTFFSGGGAQVIATPGFPVIQKLNVMGDTVRKAITEKRTIEKQVIVQAICVDDRGAPHPASRLTPDQAVGEHFRGELYRCIAGTALQATYADYSGRVAFDGGQTLACNKGDALWFEGGAILCRPQTPQRNCFERSLLRRHGVGVKVFSMRKVEEFTSFHEEVIAHSSEIALDGGVGGFVH